MKRVCKWQMLFRIWILMFTSALIYTSIALFNVKTSPPCLWVNSCATQDKVDLRLILITYNRPSSLRKCLNSTRGLVLDGDKAVMDIWIDRGKDGSIDSETLQVTKNFSRESVMTYVNVHIQVRHAGLHGQWLNPWRPLQASSEIALFLEDDVDISPYAYRWLKSVWNQYRNDGQLAGIVLQDEYIITASGPRKGITFPRPTDDPMFMYKILMPWGFVPNPVYWTEFQDWYFNIRAVEPAFLPRVPEAGLYDSWFADMISENRTESMWTMWFNYFCHMKNIYIIYSNLPKFTGQKRTSLVIHRRENGLHFSGKVRDSSQGLLLDHWNASYVQLPGKIKRYDYDGSFQS